LARVVQAALGASGDTRPSFEAASHLERGARVGRYVVLDFIGQGAMGRVYSVYDPELNRRVALKLLRPDSRTRGRADLAARLQREAQAMARVSHPNVVAVHDAGAFAEGVFVAMDLIEGETLRHWLAGERRTWRAVLDAFLQAGRGLAAAHAAGLIHRDFKPDNVLVERSGRVLVMDFGLARSVGEEPGSEDADADAPVTPGSLASLTDTGVVVGTPAYMAPEQRAGIPPSPLADQYSFCVALHEALYGDRPLRPEPDAPKGAKRTPELPERSKVPAWLRGVLARGLRADPQERFPTMDALLAALRRDPRVLRRRGLLAVAAVALLAGVIFASSYFREQSRLCTGAEEELARAWSAPQRGAVHAAFAKTGAPFAEDVWARVEPALDAYGRTWVAAHEEACRATRVLGNQSAALLDLRMECLRGRLQDLGALVEMLAHADAKAVERAVEATGSLKRLAACENPRLLLARVPPPQDPEVRARVDAVRAMIARVNALSAAGQPKRAIALAQDAARQSAALGYKPLEAEALYALGRVESEGEDLRAEQSLHASALAATVSHDDEVAVRALSRLAREIAENHPREALRWADQAEAVWQRSADDPLMRASILRARGLAYERSNPPEAVRNHSEALKVIERYLGRAHLEAARQSMFLARALAESGRDQEALPYFERVLSVQERVFGSRHPRVAASLANLGTILKRLERYDEALRYLKQALALDEELFGPAHLSVGRRVNNIGNVFQELERFEEALAAHRRALTIEEAHPTEGRYSRIISLEGVGRDLLELGRTSEARVYLQRALTSCERWFGPESRQAARAQTEMGALLVRTGRWTEAAAMLTRAVTTLEHTVGQTHLDLTTALEALGEVAYAQGKPAEGLGHFERALRICEEALGPRTWCAAITLSKIGEARLRMGALAEARLALERSAAILSARAILPVRQARSYLLLAEVHWRSGETEAAKQSGRAAQAALARDNRPNAALRKSIDRFLREISAPHPGKLTSKRLASPVSP
jgi:tetratricopeptide (TPR) repeat protein/tRNA A-37 threonylcarbamoyl transferase component Bud32